MTKRLAIALWLAACSGSAHPPSAAFSAATSAVAQSAVAFDASSSASADKQQLSYRWDFGDGAHGGGAKIAHAFAEPGTYNVVLSVSDTKSHTSTKTATITVSALSLGVKVPVIATVTDASGAAISGVTVSAGGVTATTDEQGLAGLLLPSGQGYAVRLEQPGFAGQLHALDLRTPQTAFYFSAVLQARDAAAAFDATKGGTLSARDGATLTLPAGSLVDTQGKPVSGQVQIAMTAVDPTGASNAFPGQYIGVTPDAASTLLGSYGTTEYILTQGSERLQLAAGKTAIVTVPSFAGTHLDGSPVKAGDLIAQWSLDETSGTWVEEGTGKVVGAPSSPTGLALQGEVAHLSWWNADASEPHGTDGLKCRCEAQAEICAMFGKKAFTCHLNGGPQPPARDSVFRPAMYTETDIGPSGGSLPVASGFAWRISGSALGGALKGFVDVTLASGESRSDDIVLTPAFPADGTVLSDGHVTLPFSEPESFTHLLDRYRYHFTVKVGDLISVSDAPHYGTSSILRLRNADESVVQELLVDSMPASFVATAAATDYIVEVVGVHPGQGLVAIRVATSSEETVSLGFERTDTLNAGDSHRYDFAVESGAQYTIAWNTTPPISSGTVHIFDPSATDLAAGKTADSGTYVFTAAAGTYAFALQSLETTELHLQIYKSANAPGAATPLRITLPFAPVADTPLAAGATLAYVFAGGPTLTPGSVVTVAVNAPVTIAVSPGVGAALLFPQTGLVTSALAFDASAPADYLVTITNPGTSSVSLKANITAFAAVQPALTVQSAFTTGSDAGPGTFTAYTFPAALGDIFNLGVIYDPACASPVTFIGAAYSGVGLFGDGNFSQSQEGAYLRATASGAQALVIADNSPSLCAGAPFFDVFVNKLASGAIDVAEALGPLDLHEHGGLAYNFAQSTIISGKNTNAAAAPCAGFMRSAAAADPVPLAASWSIVGQATNMLAPQLVPAGLATVEMVGASACSSTIYLRQVLPPTDLSAQFGSLALVAGHWPTAPITTTARPGEHLFYSFTVSSTQSGVTLNITAVNQSAAAGGFPNIVIYAAPAGPFYGYDFAARVASLPFNHAAQGGWPNATGATSSFNLPPGTYYADVYGNEVATGNGGDDKTATVSWDFE